MNVTLNPGQSDTRRGDIQLPVAVDLTGKENYLLKISNSGGVAQFALPTAVTDIAPYVCASGAADVASGEAPAMNENFRAVLKGTCVPGDILVLADPTTAADAGKLRKQPTAGAGTWYSFAIAEEAGVDGQAVLCRRVGERATTTN